VSILMLEPQLPESSSLCSSRLELAKWNVAPELEGSSVTNYFSLKVNIFAVVRGTDTEVLTNSIFPLLLPSSFPPQSSFSSPALHS
jgi:hypothetical protein